VDFLKNWIGALLLGALLTGCSGGDLGTGTTGGGGDGGSSGGGGGRGVPTVNLGTNAQVQVLYLSGQGRRAPGSQIAVLKNIKVSNSVTDYAPTAQQGSFSPVRVQLDGYTINQHTFTYVMAPRSVKTFTQFPFEVAQIDEENVGGGTTTLYAGPPVLVRPFFNINLPLFSGRQTTLTINLNDAILRYDPVGGVVFDRAQFENENYSPGENRINGTLSDMIAFDVSAMPANQRPRLQNGQPADMVHFSGDLIGISKGYDTPGTFELLNPALIDTGLIKRPVTLPGREAPGTYSVQEADPRDPFGSGSKITAMAGFYRPYTQVMSNIGDFAMVVLPNSRLGPDNQVVVFNRDGAGRITAMFQGVVRFSGASTGTVEIWSLDQLPDGTANNLVSGTLSYTRSGGTVRTGTFTFTNPPPGFKFPTSGGFVVLR
jgi:hypothetical protein